MSDGIEKQKSPRLDLGELDFTSVSGSLYAMAAFFWWGMLPAYLHLLDSVPTFELLAHRIIWCVPLLLGFTHFMKRWEEVKRAVASKKTLILLFVSALLISLNWLTYIYAVETNNVVEASLGYYIGPLVNVVLGVFILREKLTQLQIAAVFLAAIGVLYLTFQSDGFPWIAFVLAFSFYFYGFVRKAVGVAGVEGLFVETCILFPFGFAFLLWLHLNGEMHFFNQGLRMDLLTAFVGVVTAMPLIWFAAGAKRLRYSTIGFLQYITPTCQFLTAVLVFSEPFDQAKLISFIFIWLASGVYLIQSVKDLRQSVATQKA